LAQDRLVEAAFNLPLRTPLTYRLPEGIDATVGCRVKAHVRGRPMIGFVVGQPECAPPGLGTILEITAAVDAQPIFDGNTLDLARWMAGAYMCSLGEALAAMLPGGKRAHGLQDEDSGWDGEEEPPRPSLSGEQEHALSRILSAREGRYYLFGVTGSGKTEVYLRAAQEIAALGRGIIYLVPEISLTHQAVRIFGALFRDRLAVLHSGLTPSQRLGEWRRVRDGEVDVAIGPRSAVFAPFRDLGLILIDEEQDGAYKSSATPRYHARQVAQARCTREKAVLVMGSATPSLEAWQKMREGSLVRLNLTGRLSGGQMPQIEVVDMKREKGPLSAALREEIRGTVRAGRQAILFLNRRGFSYLFHCRSCGFEMQCRNCSVSLTYHKERNLMVCHYCGATAAPMGDCPDCGSLDVGYSGYGTEGIEEDVRLSYPALTVRRIDTDSVRKKKELKVTLEEFHAGRIHVLLGTQMVAKGLDFPGVRLVGIVLADTGFQLPDFRAAERTFSLLVQVAGRAGRALPDGKVIIQTYRPGHPAIVMAREGKLEQFYESELAMRKLLRFPPFTRLIRLILRGKDKGKVEEAASKLGASLKAAIGDAGDVLGPAECPIAVIARNHRFHLLLRSEDFPALHRRTREALWKYRALRGLHLEIDVDPLSLL
jgi:primosomal protein N' (replication factor Y) (superfamily II helicase)